MSTAASHARCKAEPDCLERRRQGQRAWQVRCMATPDCRQRRLSAKAASETRRRQACFADPDCEARWKEKARHRDWRRKYGLTPIEVDTLYARAGGVCEVCGTSDNLNIDHDHATGLVRGLLCHNCNAALGMLSDDPERTQALARYAVSHLPKEHLAHQA